MIAGEKLLRRAAEKSCWEELLRKAAEKSCWEKLLRRAAEKSCWEELLRKASEKSCWEKLLRRAAEKSCWEELLRKAAEKSWWKELLRKAAERSCWETLLRRAAERKAALRKCYSSLKSILFFPQGRFGRPNRETTLSSLRARWTLKTVVKCKFFGGRATLSTTVKKVKSSQLKFRKWSPVSQGR